MKKSLLPCILLSFMTVATIGCGQAEYIEEKVETSVSGTLVFEDGKAQPIFEYSDLRNPEYTNEDSDILRYCVYVETDYDTDSDGMADLVKVLMQVPRAAAYIDDDWTVIDDKSIDFRIPVAVE